jgi:hypothetical protein
MKPSLPPNPLLSQIQERRGREAKDVGLGEKLKYEIMVSSFTDS